MLGKTSGLKIEHGNCGRACLNWGRRGLLKAGLLLSTRAGSIRTIPSQFRTPAGLPPGRSLPGPETSQPPLAQPRDFSLKLSAQGPRWNHEML